MLIFFIIAISGCTSTTTKHYDSNKYSFNYTDGWTIAFDDSNNTDGGLDFNGTGLLRGGIYTLDISNQIPETFIKTYEGWTWSNPKQLNGNTYYEGVKTGKNNPNLVYNLGLFVKNNISYVITVNGDNNTVTKGFYTIRDSFQVK